MLTKIRNRDFIFENSLVKIIANRNSPEIKLVGLNVGPFEEGNEYEVQQWIACKLEELGVARFRAEERLDSTKIYKIQWRARIQTAGQITKLPEYFYPKLRRYLEQLKRELEKKPEKMREYNKTRQLAGDIVSLRLKKIVLLASAPAQTEQVLKKFTDEERFIYDQLFRIINRWRTQILNYEGVEEW